MRLARLAVVVAASATLTVGAMAGTAQAGQNADKANYKFFKSQAYRDAGNMVKAAKADLLRNGSPTDLNAFFDSLITAAIGAGSPPTPVALPEKCATAVQPVRNAMAKYSSSTVMPVKESMRLINNRLNKARMACGPDSVAWATFYFNEFDSWSNSRRSWYTYAMDGNELRMTAVLPKRFDSYAPICQKLYFNADGWLERSSCRK